MRRGTNVHTVFEEYYLNVIDLWERETYIYNDLTLYLPDDVELWADYIEPYVSNFLLFEQARRETVVKAGDRSLFIPVAVEAEVWDWDHEIPLMGFADVILHAASVPGFEDESGVLIIDHKTGNEVKAEKYKNYEGSVLDELEYYAMLFEDEYEIAAIAGYFPRGNVLIDSRPDPDRRVRLETTIRTLFDSGTDIDNYPIKPGPLCAWKKDPDCQSYYYEMCEECRWGTPDGPGPTVRDSDKQPL
jgi:hypothetical protein